MTKPSVKALKETSWSSRLGLNLTRTTPPCYNNTTLGNRLYAQRKGPNVTNQFCLTCKNCSYKSAADCEYCVTQSSTESSNISTPDWDINQISTIYFDVRPSQMREVTKIETGSRIAMPWPRDGRHLEKWILRHHSVADGPIWTKFDRQMQIDMYAEAAWRALWRCPNWPHTCPKTANMNFNKRLCYCRGTARRATSVEILWPFFDWAIDKKLC